MEVMLQIWRLFNYIIYQGCRKWRQGSVKFIHSEKATKFCKISTNYIFDWQYIGQIICGDFAKFCGLFRIYELYKFPFFRNWDVEELGELKEMTGKLRSSQFLRVWFPKCDIIQEIDEKLLYHEKTKKRALLAILFQMRLQKIICPIMHNHFRFFFLHHGTR